MLLKFKIMFISGELKGGKRQGFGKAVNFGFLTWVLVTQLCPVF